jgi:hypothetical protein
MLCKDEEKYVFHLLHNKYTLHLYFDTSLHTLHLYWIQDFWIFFWHMNQKLDETTLQQILETQLQKQKQNNYIL